MIARCVALCGLLLLSGCFGIRPTKLSVPEEKSNQTTWGEAEGGLQAGLSVTWNDGRFKFVGHLKNVSDKPIRLMDPLRSGKVEGGTVASVLEEVIEGRTPPDTAEPETSADPTVELVPGKEILIPLKYRIDTDEVPYSARLSYIYFNQVPSVFGPINEAVTVWTGTVRSGTLPVVADFGNSKAHKPNRGG